MLLPHWPYFYLIFLLSEFWLAGCLLLLHLWTFLVLLLCLSECTFSPTWHKFVIWYLCCIFRHGVFALMALVTILVLAVFFLLHSGSGLALKSVFLHELKFLEAVSLTQNLSFRCECKNSHTPSGFLHFHFFPANVFWGDFCSFPSLKGWLTCGSSRYLLYCV